jgi:hypothetical protein
MVCFVESSGKLTRKILLFEAVCIEASALLSVMAVEVGVGINVLSFLKEPSMVYHLYG